MVSQESPSATVRNSHFLSVGCSSILAAFLVNACATAATDNSGDVSGDQSDAASGTTSGDDSGTGPTQDGSGGGGGGQDSSSNACVPGGSCSTNAGAPCLTGAVQCLNDGTTKCIDATFASAGIACGAGNTCDGQGNCVASGGDGGGGNEGGACTPGGACSTNPGAPCKTGAIACNGGVSSCVDNGNASQGTSCGGANVCDGNGNCVTPDAGGGCTPGGVCSSNPGAPCKTGTVVCNGGVASCADNGNAAPGTACGNGKLCDGNGQCTGGVGNDGGTSCHVVVNEVQTAGNGGASDEWVEIFNPCASSVDLTGHKLVYRSASGTTDVSLVSLSGSMAANAYRLYVGVSYAGGPSADGTFSNGLSGTAGGVAIRDANGTIVDSVGYGAATNAFVETTAAIAPPSAQSIGRHPNGTDTNNNTFDFKVYTTPSPKAANP